MSFHEKFSSIHMHTISFSQFNLRTQFKRIHQSTASPLAPFIVHQRITFRFTNQNPTTMLRRQVLLTHPRASSMIQELVFCRNVASSSSSSTSPPQTPPPPPPPSPPSTPYVYEAPFSTAVRKVKRLSLFSCACALGAGPIILGLDAGSTVTAKASIAGTLASFGVFTTGLLHWFTSPYVHKLVYDPNTQSIDVTVLDVLGRSRSRHLGIHALREPDTMHPLSSFQSTLDGSVYYVDKEYFKDKKLLEAIIPSEQQQQQQQHGSNGSGGYDDGDEDDDDEEYTPVTTRKTTPKSRSSRSSIEGHTKKSQ